MQELKGKRVLVTGAASGIGRATALAFAAQGAELWLCDIDERGLSETVEAIRASGSSAQGRRVDVADREAMRAFADEVHASAGVLDVLVNNAGVALAGGFLDTPLEDWDWVVSINLWGVIHGCAFFIPPMVDRAQGGHVVNVSSSAAFVAASLLPAYSTTKFAVLGLSEALRAELGDHGIGVTAICPGVIDTPITRSVRRRGRLSADETHGRVMADFHRRGYGPEKVAARIIGAVRANRAVVPVAPEAWLLYLLKRLSPTAAAALGRIAVRRVGR
jgi:NAD(P)-dependent dehydrogenase (short-subunit alcohol dehydrogenase family)